MFLNITLKTVVHNCHCVELYTKSNTWFVHVQSKLPKKSAEKSSKKASKDEKLKKKLKKEESGKKTKVKKEKDSKAVSVTTE